MKIEKVATSPMIVNHFLYDQIDYFSKLTNAIAVTHVVDKNKLMLNKTRQ